MFTAFPPHTDAERQLHPGTVWIDLLDPTDDEAKLVTEATGLHVPTRAELSEIESSSRLRRSRDALYLSVPSAMAGQPASPIGYVLSRERLVTVHFTALPAFEAYAQACRVEPEASAGSMEVFLGLLEAAVDRLADALEREGAALEDASQRIFHPRRASAGKPRRVDAELRALVREIGTAGDQASRVRDTLLGVGRVAQYVVGTVADWISAGQRTRFETLRADIASLAEYQTRLADNVQFLLDATLGLINIEQNNIFKVLTIVSIVGIPPTFIASLYGMNFHDIPELSWSFGYWYALGLMLVTAVLPLVWFRWKGWL